MVKIKINIKSSSTNSITPIITPSVAPSVTLSIPPSIKIILQNSTNSTNYNQLSKVIPYEDDIDVDNDNSDNDGNDNGEDYDGNDNGNGNGNDNGEDDDNGGNDMDDDVNDIKVIKPKHKMPLLVKININKKTNIETQPSTESVQQPKTIVKINFKKKIEAPIVYKSHILDQKPIKKKSIEKVILPNKFTIESFYVNGQTYLINWETGYIFYMDILKSPGKIPEPIGKLTDTPITPDECKEDAYPLLKRKIDWFYYYELDVDSVG